jgi:Mycothiol maleylpyruvate isomerase N-terminal domain
MENVPLEENEQQQQRLAALVDRLDDDDLGRKTDAGWTIAMHLAYMAFWDRWADHLIRRWRTGELPPPTVPDWYDDAINATLVDQWRALPPRAAATLAVNAARSVDREIARTETPVLMAMIAAHEGHLIHRHQFRSTCLDKLDAALRA